MTAEEKKYRILGIILAAVTYAVIIVAMILTRISASSEQNSQINASENKTQIAFDGEEYVEFGDIPEPNLDDGEPAANDADNEPASDGSDQTNEGNPGDGEALVSSRHDSPMETPKKKKTGPTAAELKKQQEEQARIKKEKEQQEKEKNKINNRASNAFNRTGGNSAGHSGSPDGNASTGAVSGVRHKLPPQRGPLLMRQERRTAIQHNREERRRGHQRDLRQGHRRSCRRQKCPTTVRATHTQPALHRDGRQRSQ